MKRPIIVFLLLLLTCSMFFSSCDIGNDPVSTGDEESSAGTEATQTTSPERPQTTERPENNQRPETTERVDRPHRTESVGTSERTEANEDNTLEDTSGSEHETSSSPASYDITVSFQIKNEDGMTVVEAEAYNYRSADAPTVLNVLKLYLNTVEDWTFKVNRDGIITQIGGMRVHTSNGDRFAIAANVVTHPFTGQLILDDRSAVNLDISDILMYESQEKPGDILLVDGAEFTVMLIVYDEDYTYNDESTEAKTEPLTLPEQTEDVNDFFPDVERTDYGLDFNIFVEGSSGPDLFYMSADNNDGSPMDEAVFARQSRVERYLGVNIIGVEYPDASFQTYPKYVQTAVQNMDGSLDALITHVHSGVSNLISENLITDLSLLEGIDLDADYWNKEFMSGLELDGKYYLGYSDYIPLNTYVISFNKEMLERYEDRLPKSVYDIVKDREWTLDTMIDLAQLVYSDSTGDGKTPDDTYGITGNAWVSFCGWLTSSNVPLIEQNEAGEYKVAVTDAEYLESSKGVLSKLIALSKSYYAYFDTPANASYHNISVPLTSGRALMSTASTSQLTGFLDYDLEFGILPYPMYSSSQASVGYKSLQWGGYIAVPSYVKNERMSGEVLEMLSFYSENVNITHYEKMCGKQVADMPDDVAMFDIIRDSVTSDRGQAFSNVSTSGGYGVLYTIPQLFMPTATQGIEDYIAEKADTINEGFKNFIESIQ